MTLSQNKALRLCLKMETKTLSADPGLFRHRMTGCVNPSHP
uniref:Uncharacterized protein n=1 Tax=Anguilla anguilla TaxID=7936 RepID=A0A0E9QUW7_ANGAN